MLYIVRLLCGGINVSVGSTNLSLFSYKDHKVVKLMNVSDIADFGRIVPFMQSIPLQKKKNI